MAGFTEEELELIQEASIICEVSGYYPAYFFLLDKGFDAIAAKIVLAEPEHRRQTEAQENLNTMQLIGKK